MVAKSLLETGGLTVSSWIKGLLWIKLKERPMQALLDESVFISPLAPMLSLDSLMASSSESARPFDIPDRTLPSADDIIDTARVRLAIRRFVEDLPIRQREIVMRVFWEGESQASVARSLGISGAAVSKTLSKVLAVGRAQLKAYSEFRTIAALHKH